MSKHVLTAIIYDKKGRVLSIGQNNYTKSHTIQAKYAKKAGKPESIYLHAEIHAIIKCRSLNKAHKIFISRYDKNGKPRLAKPCPICQNAIKEAGIKIIEYTVDV
jgi:tRNA(Arg) A34 adenosine deaminase TadA